MRIPILLTPLLVALVPGVAHAQASPQTSAATPAWIKGAFGRADGDRDGQLSRGEVTQAVNRQYGRLSTGRSRIMTNMWFNRLDGDKSNRISLDEAQAFGREFWNRFDKNRDGRLTGQEQGPARAFIKNPAR
jgi:hypothetical protein